MAINDRNQGPRIARNQRAEATWPEDKVHLAHYFEGMKFHDAEKHIFKTPKTAVDLHHDVRMKVITMGHLGDSPEMQEELSELVRTFLPHYKIEELAFNCVDAYESIVRRLASMAIFSEEERQFSDMFGVDFSDPLPIGAEVLVNDGMAGVTTNTTKQLSTVVKEHRQTPPQGQTAVAAAAAKAAGSK